VRSKSKSWLRWPLLAVKWVAYCAAGLIAAAIALTVLFLLAAALSALGHWLGGVIERGVPQAAEKPTPFVQPLFVLLSSILLFLVATLPPERERRQRNEHGDYEGRDIHWQRGFQLVLIVVVGLVAFFETTDGIKQASSNRPSAAGFTVLVWLLLLGLLGLLLRGLAGPRSGLRPDRKEMLLSAGGFAGLFGLALGWAAWSGIDVVRVSLGLVAIFLLVGCALAVADGELDWTHNRLLIASAVLCAMVALSTDVGEQDRSGDQGTLYLYCTYGAESKAQLNECLNHVTVRDISLAYDQKASAGLHAYEEGHACGYDSGPFCTVPSYEQ